MQQRRLQREDAMARRGRERRMGGGGERAHLLAVDLDLAQRQVRRLGVGDCEIPPACSAALHSNLLARLGVINHATFSAPAAVGRLADGDMRAVEPIRAAVGTVREQHAANVDHSSEVELPPVLAAVCR